MATVMAPEMATQSANLRAELKEWERAFADANGGRKAERSDIKKVPEIAAKYKEYSRLKALETSSSTTKTDKIPVQLEERPKKRKHTSPNGPSTSLATSTPRKTAKGAAAFETPSKSRPVATSHPSEVDPYDSPSVLRRLFSPSTHQTPLKTAIGPTPQRDGKALGLFDLLSESGGSTATPSATRIASLRDTAVQTPSRRRKQLDTIAEEGEEEDDDEDNSPRGARTPASSGKKWMLSTLFATPTTWRYAMMENEKQGPRYPAYIRTDDTASKQTESQAGPNAEETPSFLRRATATRYNPNNNAADDGGLSPIAVRKRPQFVGKGLSALVQGLRDMEEEQMQDDMDILHEIEAEQQQQAAGTITDSQTQQQYPPTEESRPFKKKGQKRTTRKVRMKPVTAKPKPEPQLPASDNEEEEDNEADIVPETQHLNIPGTETHDTDDELNSIHSISGSEPDLDPDYDYDEEEEALSKPPARSKSFSERMKEAIEADKPQAREKEQVDTEKEKKKTKSKAQTQTQTQPRARKVNPAAHANYRSLKLRNRGSKGRYGGRFGRR